MMCNIELLRAKIDRRGITLCELADKLDISRSTLYRKLLEHGKNLSLGDVYGIISELDLSEEETINIFLSDKSRK